MNNIHRVMAAKAAIHEFALSDNCYIGFFRKIVDGRLRGHDVKRIKLAIYSQHCCTAHASHWPMLGRHQQRGWL
jgi:hypothetical protein